MRTAAARMAKAIQPHCVLLDSSFCDAAAAAAAAAAAGLTPDVVVALEIVVVTGGGDTATTVVVWDSVTVEVDRVGALTVGVDRVGALTVGVDRVGVVRVPALVRVPTAEPFPPPQAARNPSANNATIAAPPRRSNGKLARLVTTRRRSHARAADLSPNEDEPRSCTRHTSFPPRGAPADVELTPEQPSLTTAERPRRLAFARYRLIEPPFERRLVCHCIEFAVAGPVLPPGVLI
jgi:hypothetical protein